MGLFGKNKVLSEIPGSQEQQPLQQQAPQPMQPPMQQPMQQQAQQLDPGSQQAEPGLNDLIYYVAEALIKHRKSVEQLTGQLTDLVTVLNSLELDARSKKKKKDE